MGSKDLESSTRKLVRPSHSSTCSGAGIFRWTVQLPGQGGDWLRMDDDPLHLSEVFSGSFLLESKCLFIFKDLYRKGLFQNKLLHLFSSSPVLWSVFKVLHLYLQRPYHISPHPHSPRLMSPGLVMPRAWLAVPSSPFFPSRGTNTCSKSYTCLENTCRPQKPGVKWVSFIPSEGHTQLPEIIEANSFSFALALSELQLCVSSPGGRVAAQGAGASVRGEMTFWSSRNLLSA